MSKSGLIVAAAIAALGALPQRAPAQESSLTIESKKIVVKYAGPSMKGRKIFGAAAPYNQVWKIGETAPVAFHTDTDLVFKGFNVAKGDYSLYILVGADRWQLIVNKQTGAKAATYDPKADVGRAVMTLGKTPAPVETCKVTLTKTAALAGKIEVAWESTTASASFFLDRAAEHSEW